MAFDEEAFDQNSFSTDSWLFAVVDAVRRVARDVFVFVELSTLYVTSLVEELHVRTKRVI